MKRIVVLLALFILPLQYSWAALSVYCGHETSGSAQHFGHHYHPQHQSLDDKDGAGDAAGFTHADCGLCHLAHSYAVQPTSPAPSISGNLGSIVAQQHTTRSFIPDGPERPNWGFSSLIRRDA